MGTMERRDRERRQREEQIVNAAEKVFFARGFDNSTMADVATTAELSKGALYTYFKNKNELCISIVGRALALALSGFERAWAEQNRTGLQLVHDAGMSFKKFSQAHPKYYCALLSYRHHRGGCGADSRFLQGALDGNRRINELLIAMLRKGVADGSVRAAIDAEQVARALWGELGGLIPGFILNEENSADAGLFDQALELICNGLKNK